MSTRNSVSLVSSEPLGLELVAERLNVEDCAVCGLICILLSLIGACPAILLPCL